jgi:hypothetical protein
MTFAPFVVEERYGAGGVRARAASSKMIALP